MNLYILLCLAYVGTISTTEPTWKSTAMNYPKLMDTLEQYGIFEDELSESEDEFQDATGVDMKHYLETIFRFWNFKGTQFGEFLKAGHLPDLKTFEKVFSLPYLYKRLKNDEDLQMEITQMITSYLRQQEEKDQRRDSELEFNEVANQTMGYEGCKRDYDALAEPITNALIKLVVPNLPLPIEDRDMERWGWLMFDALAKVPEGLGAGKLHWVGSYELCNKIEVSYNYTEAPRIFPPYPGVLEPRQFKAKYCRLDFNPDPPRIGNGSDFLRFQIGICVPDTCSSENISTYLTSANDGNLVFGALSTLTGLRLDEVYCGQVTDFDNDPDIKGALAIILTCLSLLVLATLYDGLVRPSLMKPYTEKMQKKEHLARSISQVSFVSNMVDPTPTILPENTRENQVNYARGISQDSNDSESSVPTHIQEPQKTNDKDKVENGRTDAKNPGIQRQTSYHEIHNEDRRRYSQDLSKPPLQSQTSVTSMTSISPLVEDLASKQSEQDKATILDRLEVAFVGFSAYTNLARIFNTEHGIENEMPALNGVRFLSWAYALYGHSWLFGPIYNECWTTSNLLSAVREYPKKWSFQPVINFHFSSDAFFVISGCLVTYWWLKRYDHKQRISFGMILRYYVQRYWMLVPALMMVLMTYATTYRYLGSGPLFPINVGDADNCKTNWWTDLLLVHNLVNVDSTCLTWTWYTGILWQLHIITPIVLIPLVLYPVAGYIMLAVLYITHVGATAGVVDRIVSNEDEGAKDWARDYFLTPWCRAGPYCVGIALGIILHRFKLKAKLHLVFVILGWIVAMICICSVEYATYGILKEDGERWDKGTRVMYDTFSRTSYGIGVAWIIFACVTGNGGIINTILSWKLFIPLSRIVYPSYLMHAMMVFTFVYGQYSLLYVNEANVRYWFFGHLWIVHIVGLFYVGLLFYFPISFGLIRAFSVKTKEDCVKAGNHNDYTSTPAVNFYIAQNDNQPQKNYQVPSVSSVTHGIYDDLRHRGVHLPGNSYETLEKKKTTEL